MAPAGLTAQSFLQLLHGPGIQVKVGPAKPLPWGLDYGERSWSLPRALISHHSPFLRAACAEHFREGIEGLIKLPVDRAFAFEKFIEWMHFGDYTVDKESYKEDWAGVAAELWILGDKMGVDRFANCAMRHLYGLFVVPENEPVPFVSATFVRYVLDNTMEQSLLRNFLVDIAVANWGDRKVIQCNDAGKEDWSDVFDLHSEFRDDLLEGLNQDDDKRRDMPRLEHYMFYPEMDEPENHISAPGLPDPAFNELRDTIRRLHSDMIAHRSV